MPKELIIYISVRFNYEQLETELWQSIAVLEGCSSIKPMFPDDPALTNIYLVETTMDDSDKIMDVLQSFEAVDFAEFIDKPEIRR